MENLLNAKIMSDLKLNIDEFVEKQVDFFDILKRPIKTFAFEKCLLRRVLNTLLCEEIQQLQKKIANMGNKQYLDSFE